MKVDKCYGVVVVSKEEEYKFLILLHAGLENNWSFPKGHMDEGETPIETALREVEEETGIKEIEIIDTPLINEEYKIVRNGEDRLKQNGYFMGFVKNKNVSIQEGEIQDCAWLTYSEAMERITYKERKEALKKAKEYLDKI